MKFDPNRRQFLKNVTRTAGGVCGVGIILALQQQQSLARQGVALRPPGALADEWAFNAACIRCGQCVQACPYEMLHLASLLSPMEAGTPYFIARDKPCEMCSDIPCVKACPSGALDPQLTNIDDARMGLSVLLDQENCLNWQGLRCDVCYRVCPLIDKAITLELQHNERSGKHAKFIPTVHSDACTGCGKCEEACVRGSRNQSIADSARKRHFRQTLPFGLAGKREIGTFIVRGTKSRRDLNPAYSNARGATIMANSPQKAGVEARQTLGWWRAYRFLILRRVSQLSIILMFLAGPLWQIWLLRGNYSSSLLLDVIPLSDPLIVAESLATGYLPQWKTLLGAGIITIVYAVLASKAFCGWVCPLNIVTDLAAWLRRKLGIRQSAKLPRTLRYSLLVMILVGSAISGSLLWEWINPVAAFGRIFVYGLGATLWLILAIFLFDLLIVEHGWCGHLCPLGATYALLGAKSVVRVGALNRDKCDRCMDCFHVCPEPQVLRQPLFSEQHSPLIVSKDCISCGRCVDVCAENVFCFTTRFHKQIPVVNK